MAITNVRPARKTVAEKEKLFAKRLYETGDKREAARAITESQNPAAFRTVTNKYMKSQGVQDELKRLETKENEFTRDDLKRRILESLSDTEITATQKKDLYNLYEKTTRFEIERDAEAEEKAILAQLEIGDAIEKALEGDTLKFDQFFDIQTNVQGKPTIRLKKNDLESKKLAYLTLLTLMKKQNVFASGM